MIENDLVQALSVTAELCGTDLSPGAAKVLADELAQYDRAQVLGALRMVRREHKGRLTMGAILERLDDGRPGPDEAFAMLPHSEADTVVWTDEMAAAAGTVLPILAAGDKMAARLAWREVYTRMVNDAREAKKPARWWASLGHDVRGRESAVVAAIDAGRLKRDEAVNLLGYEPGAPKSGEIVALCAAAVGRA